MVYHSFPNEFRSLGINFRLQAKRFVDINADISTLTKTENKKLLKDTLSKSSLIKQKIEAYPEFLKIRIKFLL